MLEKINNNEIKSLCEQHNVEKLYLFGSILDPESFSLASDVDVLVKFKAADLAGYFTNFMSFKERLKSLFKREVDLVEEQTLRNPILINSINKTKKLIYG